MSKDIDRIINKAKEITSKDTFQAMEALVHNLNTLHCLQGDSEIVIDDDTPLDSVEMYDSLDPSIKQLYKLLLDGILKDINISSDVAVHILSENRE